MGRKKGRPVKLEIWKKLTKEVLHQLYVSEKKTLIEIGKIIGCSHCTISKALKKHGIKTRTTSEAMKLFRAKRK